MPQSCGKPTTISLPKNHDTRCHFGAPPLSQSLAGWHCACSTSQAAGERYVRLVVGNGFFDFSLG